MTSEQVNDILQLMRDAPRWLVWKSIPGKDNKKKPRKVPYYTNGSARKGTLDSPEDVKRLVDFDTALNALNAGGYSGLGFALGKDGGGHWQGVDFDKLSDHPELGDLLTHNAPGYTEYSPGGDGAHFIGYGKYFPSLGSNASGIEAYSSGRYFTVTGNVVAPGDIEDLASFVNDRLKQMHSSVPPSQEVLASLDQLVNQRPPDWDEFADALFSIPADDREVWQKMGHALKTLDVPEAFVLFLEWSATSDKHNPDEDAKTWKSFKPTQTGYKAVFAEAYRCGWKPPLKVSGPLTDLKVSTQFCKQYSDKVRWRPDINGWLVYDGTRWTTQAPGGPFPYLKEMVGKLYVAAHQLQDDTLRQSAVKAIVGLESHRRQETVLSAATVIPGMIVNSHQLDRDPMLLNCRNGTLDLATGQLRSHNPEDFITRRVNIDYAQDAACPEFMKFLEKVLGGNEQLINYLQRFVGYCLTGKTTEQVLLFLYGTGANGKTTLANIMEDLLGDYASTAGSDLLMQRDNKSSTNDLAALQGARLVKVSEFNDGERLAEATIKTMTGGDRVTCRFLYGEFFEYTPAYKILLLGNYKPRIQGRDRGIWRRINLLPFNVTITEHERDPELMSKLRAELPGILSWAVRGCLDWQKGGLCQPKEIIEEVSMYRQGEDVFAQWLGECCSEGEGHLTQAKDLLNSFIEFSNWRKITPTRLGRLLAERGFIKEKSGVVWWRGISLNPGGFEPPVEVDPLS